MNSNKNITLIVYGGHPIALDLITTLLSEDGIVIAADTYEQEKQDLFQELRKNENFKYITLDAISKINVIISKIDYIFILLDQYIDNKSSFSSNEYLSILNVINKTLEYAQNRKTKVIITFPLNVYPEENPKQYTIQELLTNIKKKISEIHQQNSMVRIAFTGEVLGHGMHLNNNTPLKKLLIEAITDDKITINGEGLESYYAIYSSDYVYGLVKSNFSKSENNYILTIPEKITLLTFAYKIIEFNPTVKDIIFKERGIFKEEDSILKKKDIVEQVSVKFNLDELTKGVTTYLFEVLKRKPLPKPQPVIENISNVEIEDTEEEITLLGKFLIVLKNTILSILKFLKNVGRTIKYSWSIFVHNPKKLTSYTIAAIIIAIISCFLIIPVTSLGVNTYLLKRNLSTYTTTLLSTNEENYNKEIDKIKTNSSNIHNAWKTLSWIKYIPKAKNYYTELSKAVTSLEYFSNGMYYWNLGAKPIVEYLNAVDISQIFNTTATGNSREYTLELQKISENSHYLTLANEEFFKASSQIQLINEEILPEKIQIQITGIKDLISENNRYIDSSISVFTQIPDLMGINGRKRYILLFHNPYELRPQGGWISGYALIDIEHGKIKSIKFDNIYNLDGIIKNQNMFIQPPTDMELYLPKNDSWSPSTINWDPDYEDMHEGFEKMLSTMGVTYNLDGIISINIFVLQDLLTKVGPIQISSLNTPVSSENLLENIVEYHSSFNPSSIDNKPDILSEVSQGIYNKIVNEKQIPVTDLLNLFKNELDQKNIILSVKNPIIENEIRKLKWNGSLNNYNHSIFIYPLEWSTSGNKANAFLDRKIDLSSKISSGILTSDLKITYDNKSTSNYYPQGKYEALLRLILPANTSIQSVNGVKSYEVERNSEYTVVYINLSVDIKTSTQISVIFIKEISDTQDIILVKQPGLTKTIYTYTIDNVPQNKQNAGSGTFEKDVKIEK